MCFARILTSLLIVTLLSMLVVPSVVHSQPVEARGDVSLLLVLAIDVSDSVKEERWGLQKNAYAQAFRDPEIVQTIIQVGGIAVTLVQWSEEKEQDQSVPWHVIKDRPSAEAFATAVATMSRKYHSFTSITTAILFSTALIEKALYRAPRRVIDISGDGEHNDLSSSKPTVAEARTLAVSKHITINGLPMNAPKETAEYNQRTIREYEHNVIGGPNAFLLYIPDADSPGLFFEALKRKLFHEISATLPTKPGILYATR